MLLTKSRIPIVITGIIALSSFALIIIAGQVNAGDSRGDLTTAALDIANFEDGKPIGAGTGWDWTGEGNVMKVAIFLDAAVTNIAEIEVFVEATTTDTQPVFSQRPTAGGVFPTGVNFGFTLTVPNTRQITGQTALVDATSNLPLVPGTTRVGIHLVDANDVDIARSAAPVNTTLVDLSAVVVSAPVTEEEDEGAIAPPPTPTPPATGDVAPGSGSILGLMLVGLFLILAGGVYLARSRKPRT